MLIEIGSLLLNYQDFIAWSFETYGTQRWEIVVYDNIDFKYTSIRHLRRKILNIIGK